MKRQKSSRGTARSTRLTRSQSSTSRNTQQQSDLLSRFFKKIECDDHEQQNQSIYMEAITETQTTSSHNLSDDFVSPPKAKKIAQIFTDVKENVTRRTTRSKSGPKTTKKCATNEEKKLLAIGKGSDVNMEHLQLALAMSKSMEPELCGAEEDIENIYPSTQQIGDNARLELLGYRKKITGQSSSKQPGDSVTVKGGNSRKKSKFRYVKPKLLTRTDAERERIIQDKIALILSHSVYDCPPDDQIVEEIHSYVLQDNVSRNRILFNSSQQVQKDIYYVHALNLEKSQAKCGCLLKNWNLIPGREQSQENEVNTSVLPVIGDEVKLKNVENDKTAGTNSICFESDKNQDGCESNISQNVVTDVDDFSLSENFIMITSQFESVSKQDTGINQDGAATPFASHLSQDSASQNNRKITRSESPDLFASSDEDCDEEVIIANKTKFENLASASLLSNVNAMNFKESENILNDSDSVFEDDRGICTYEIFSDCDERLDHSASDDNVIISPKAKNSSAAIAVKDQTNFETNEQLEEELKGIEGVPEVNDSATNCKGNNCFQDNVNNSTINDSIVDQTYNNDSLVSENRKSWMTMNVTHHVEALLNSETFINDYKSICIEEYFNSTNNQIQDNNSIVQTDQKVNQAQQITDLSQDKIDSDSDDECIDLSQDSDDAGDSKTPKTNLTKNSRSLQRNLSSKSLNSTASTNESICISDEELNYSCLNATPTARQETRVSTSWKYSKLALKKHTFAISDSEEDDDGNTDGKDNLNEINVTKLLEQIKEREESDLNCNKFDNREESDEELQEALKLSLIEAENDQKRRQKDKLIASCSNEHDIVVIADEIDVNHQDPQGHQEIEKNLDQDGGSSVVFQNDGFDAEKDFADSFPSIHMNFQTSDTDNDQDKDSIAVDKVASVSMEIHADEIVLNHQDNNSFPSFDHDNFDHYEPNFTIHPCATPTTSKDVKSTGDNAPDEFDLLVESNNSVFHKHSSHKKPQCRRIQELINTNKTPTNDGTSKISDNKRASVTFEDTFANLLEQTNVLNNLDQLKTPPSNKAVDASAGTPATPADGLYVKTAEITPMPMFDQMTTPEIHSELDRIGVKRMKRRRGVQMLKHIYNSMHLQLEKQDIQDVEPVNVDIDVEDLNRPKKRRKKLNYDEELHDAGQDGPAPSIIEINTRLAGAEALEDLVFERKQSKRIKSCALPFHIAWHNFLCANRDIWENVLLYEPLQVEVLYAMFKELGFKYHIQDMIAFFDKKCVTIRIKQNN